VSLIVTSDNNCTDTIVQTIDIYPIPVAGFTTGNVCLYDPAVFSDLSSVSSGNIVSWFWQFDDGNTSTSQNPAHSYSANGTYAVILITLSNNNCADTAIQSLTIYPVPTADFTTNNVCLYDAAVFTDATSINSPGNIVSWSWDLGDGLGTSTSQNPSYNYISDGLFNVLLTATSDNNCIDDTTYIIEIYPVPLVFLTADTLSGCEPLCVTFVATPITGGTISTWDWDFGDGNVSVGQTTNNCYTAIDESTARLATVILIATSSDGCLYTLTMLNMIDIWPKPIGGFTAGPQPTTILASAIDFADQSLGNVVSWSWDFGDGDTVLNAGPGGANPTHVYIDTGTYNIEQIIKNQFFCSDTSEGTIVIMSDYIFHIPNSFTPNEDGINETFIPQGIGLDGKSFEMFIYNRWGDLVFKTDDINIPWDGKANDGRKMAQEGVYVWMVFTSDLELKKHKHIGHVTLLR